MLILSKRIKHILEELKDSIYTVPMQIEQYKFKKTTEKGMEKFSPQELDWDIITHDELWGGHRENYWFVTEVTVPPTFDGKCISYQLTTGTEDAWDAINAQFRLFVNGRIVQGLDVNHRSAILSEHAVAGEILRIALYAFTGDHNEHLSLNSKISILNPEIEKLFYDLEVPCEVATFLNDEDDAYIEIIHHLNEAINLLDLRIPFSEEFYRSIAAAQTYITKEFYEKRCGSAGPEVWCVGHTHIDVAWLWTLSVTKDKAFRNFATTLELMRRYSDYIFMSSQPQLYKYVKEESPELFEEIKKYVKEGRWEAEGGMFLESDCNIASGESLVRQILYGKEFFRDEFGVDNKVLWLPDVFGYSAALPQILQKSGMPYFMTTKIGWNDTNKMPYDTFMWKGIDGTSVLTHFIPTCDYDQDPKNFTSTYNGRLEPRQVKGAWRRYQQKSLNNKVLMSFGFGDGGGGPTTEMLEQYQRLKKGIPGCPKAVMTTSRSFFEQLEADVKGNKYLPNWTGELYLEFHRGTYTSMARNKKYNRKSEFLLQNAEAYSVLGNVLAHTAYPQKMIRSAWEVILRNQFHDILPGSSIKEVYEESKQEYEEVLASGRTIVENQCLEIARNIACEEASVVIFNPLGFECSDVVTFDLPENFEHPVLFDESGDELPCQRIEGGKAIFVAARVPAKGYKTFVIRESSSVLNTGLEISEKEIANRFYHIKLDSKGRFEEIYDKAAARQILKPGEKGNVLTAYEDKPFEYDAWNLEEYYKEKSWPVDDIHSVEMIENGPVRGCVKVTAQFLNSTIVQYVYIYADLPRIDVKNSVDWKETQVHLRAAFPIDVHADEATYEIQYGNVKRPTHSNTSWDAARFEVCAHKWADLSEDGYGVSLMNDCKYGHAIHDGVMSLALLKSAVYPNPDADKEHHEFVYSLYPHQGGWREAGTVQQAYALNNPMEATFREKGAGALPQVYGFVQCDAANVVMDVLKKEEYGDGIILRLYECYNRRSTVKLNFVSAFEKVEECNLLENSEQNYEVSGNSVSFTIKPYEIKTFKLILKDEEK